MDGFEVPTELVEANESEDASEGACGCCVSRGTSGIQMPGDEMRRKHGRSGGIGKCNLNFVE